MRMKTFCVIGLGSFGVTIAKKLSKLGNEVVVLDEDQKRIDAIADDVAMAMEGDVMSEQFLKSAGIADCDCAIICLSGRINDTILLVMMAKEIGIPFVVARANSEIDCRVLKKVGADEVIFPERDMGERLAYSMERSDVLEHLRFSDEYSIVEKTVPKSWIGKTLIEVNVRRNYGVNIIAICNADHSKINISPEPDRKFQEEDMITMIGSDKSIDKISQDG
jgi:trk system potassium uptake protein TrkA